MRASAGVMAASSPIWVPTPSTTCACCKTLNLRVAHSSSCDHSMASLQPPVAALAYCAELTRHRHARSTCLPKAPVRGSQAPPSTAPAALCGLSSR